MRCDELFAALVEYIDGDIDPQIAAAIERHLAECPVCELMLDNQPPVRIKPGACIYIPTGVNHYTANVGNEPMITLIVYSPLGPEKGLREIPGCKIIPPE